MSDIAPRYAVRLGRPCAELFSGVNKYRQQQLEDYRHPNSELFPIPKTRRKHVNADGCLGDALHRAAILRASLQNYRVWRAP